MISRVEETEYSYKYDGVISILLDQLNSPSYQTYTECTLQSLFVEKNERENSATNKEGVIVNYFPTINDLYEIADGCTNVSSDYKWIDICFRTQHEHVEKLDMRKSQDNSQELWIRHYLYPSSLKDICVVRQLSSSHVVKSLNRSISNVRRVKETHCDSEVVTFLLQLGFKMVSMLYVKARLYHLQYSTSSHVILIIQQHFKDENFSELLFPNRWLVEAKTRSTEDTTVDTAESVLASFVVLLTPLVYMRKCEEDKILNGL